MAKPKKVPQPEPTAITPIDAQSPDVVLEYSGGATPRGVPARDLTGNDLARIAYHRAAAAGRASRRQLIAPGEQREPVARPGRASQDDLEALATELSATGRFSRNAPALAEPPTELQPDNPPPAAPAPEPEA